MKTRMAGFLALGLLAACGTNPQDRVTGGAAAGAATGAGVGALGGPVGALAGAGIGGAAGAITGATTSPNQVNLGTPIWNDPEVRVPGGTTASNTSGRARGNAQTRDLQQALTRQGYDVGPADGVYGARTRQAVMDYQQRHNMPATGRPDSQLMSSLGATGGTAGTTSGARTVQGGGDRSNMGGGASGGTTTVPGMPMPNATGAGAPTGGALGGGPATTTRQPPTGVNDPNTGVPQQRLAPNQSGGGAGGGASSGGPGGSGGGSSGTGQ